MADTENTEKERSWGEATIDVIGNMADTYAKTGRLLPSLVSGIPAALNTESFQEKKNKLAFDAWRRQQLQTNAEREDMLFQQSQEDRPIHRQLLEQKAQNSALLLQQQQIRTDNLYYNEGLKRTKQEALERFRENPVYSMLNSDEKNRFDNSVQMQKFSEFLFFADEFQNAWKIKDEKSIARLQRMASKDGLTFEKNENGEYTLSGNGFSIPINDKNRGTIGNYLAQNAAKEFAAIYEISQNSTYARADRKIHSAYTNALAENSVDTSLSKNLQLVKDTIKAMPQSWKNTMLLRRICDDLLSSDYDDVEKQQEAMAAISSSPDTLSILEQEGFRLQPGAVGFADAKFFDTKTKRVYNINEMHDILVERDKGTAHLNNLVQKKKYEKQAAIATAERKQKIEAIRILNAQAQMSKQGKGNTAGTGTEKDKASLIPTSYIQNNSNNYVDLSSDQKTALGSVFETFEKDNDAIFKKLPKELTPENLDTLKTLDRSWQKILKDKKLDEDKFPSPVKKDIIQLEIEKLHQSALALRKKNAEIEKAEGYKLPDKEIVQYQPGGGIRTSQSDTGKQYDKNAREIRSIEDKIKKIREENKNILSDGGR